LRKGEWCSAVSIGKVYICPGLDQGLKGLGVPRAPVAKDNGFEHRGPTEIVDVVERRARADERSYNFRMP
jgi:hypothetical protein